MNPLATAPANIAILEPGLALTRPVAAPQLMPFEQIMREHNQRLFRLAFSLMGEESEAEDVLQASYVRAFQKMPSFAGRSSLGAWLASIVRHEAIDQLRARRARRARVSLEAEILRSGEVASPALSEARTDAPGDSPEIGAHREEFRKLLERAIASLPASFRAVFLLREVEGLSIQETAEYLGVPPATVKTRDYRARSMLRRKLGDQVDAATWQVFEFLGARCAGLTRRVMERLAR